MKKLLSFALLLLVCNFCVFAQGNSLPGAYLILNNLPKNDTTTIELFPGDSLNLVLHTSDPNSTDSVWVTSDCMIVLPGSTFTTNNTLQQSAYFNWIPTVADAHIEPYVVMVRMEDNSYPIKGIYIFHLKIRVNKPQSILLNNARVDLNHEITLEPGSPFNFRVSSSDPNSNDSITVTSNVAAILPGAIFSTDNAKQQTATINWTPTSADVRAQLYSFTVTVHDKANPASAQFPYVVKVRVSNTGGVTGLKTDFESNASFIAFPNPFSETVRFRFDLQSKAESIMIYNLLGQPVDQITVSNAASGQQEIQWPNASKHAAGIYIAKLISEDKTIQTLKFTKLQ